jgi:hypothetical protein
VTGPFANSVIAVSLIMSAWAVVLLIVNRPPGRALLAGAVVLEVMVVVFAAGGLVQMFGSDRDFARVEFVGYLLACAGLIPAAAWWVRDEKSRAAAGVLAVVFLVVPVLVIRTQQVWTGTGA